MLLISTEVSELRGGALASRSHVVGVCREVLQGMEKLQTVVISNMQPRFTSTVDKIARNWEKVTEEVP